MLPATYRLRDPRDFRRVYARGRSLVHRLAVLYVSPRDTASAGSHGLRIGFVVSRKQGGAAARNRIKRRLREAVRRRLEALVHRPVDLIFVCRSGLKSATWPEVQAAVEELLGRAGLLNREKCP
ncbi:MAG: ribonuclease P protein component [Chloroherpetonaceae bacterium]|nr:ribonuclease P protein component [Chthonomonadaceae bacterium]MDW8208967.1 ribonuclease P protein component [Chloroherpetonaceae bacterium]